MIGAPVNIAPFGSGVFPVQAIVARSVTDRERSIVSVLIQTEDDTVNHPAWPDAERRVRPSHWSHLVEVIGAGGGDVGPGWTAAGFETTADDASVAAIAYVLISTTEIVLEPLRAGAGVLVPGAMPDGSALVLPLHLLRDDDGRLHVLVLDPARIDRYGVTLSYRGNARRGTFHSTAYPRLDKCPSWQVAGGITLGVGYGGDSIEVNLRGRRSVRRRMHR